MLFVDVSLFIVLLVLLVPVLLLYGLYRFLHVPYQVLKRCGIKGPTPVPFFGNYIEEARMTKLSYYTHLNKAYGPVVGFYIGQKPHIMITDADMLKQIMVKDFNNFMDHADGPEIILPNIFRGLFLMKGETWKRNRRILSPTFSISKVKMMAPVIEKGVDILVQVFGEKVTSGKSFDVSKVYGSFTTETILAVAFGRLLDDKVDKTDDLIKAVASLSQQIEEDRVTSFETLIAFTSNFPWMTPILRFFFLRSSRSEGFRHLNKIALELVKNRRNNLKKYRDMLQLMIDATDEGEEVGDEKSKAECPVCRKTGKLTNEEVVGEAIGILLAGYETTANTLAYTSYLLTLHPDIQEKLQSEIDDYFDNKPDSSLYEASQEITYLDNVVQESLRLFPPVPIITRLCLKTTVVKTVTIPKGASIVVPCFIIHNNPVYWKDPDTFDPNRFTAEEKAKRPQLCHLPFGFGPRSCIGMKFALLEAKMALIELLKRYTFVKAPDTEVPLKMSVGFTMSAKNGIYLVTTTRQT